ncbi:MAG: acyl-CoA dehydrogenase [Paracoccaceae bacterium]|jgi:acyl-CoA dehydrogenase
MSVFFLLIGSLVLLYLGIGGTTAVTVLVATTVAGMMSDSWHFASIMFGALALAATLFLLIPSKLREQALSRPLLSWVRGMLPQLSETEAEALKSGSVEWDGELFSGNPDWEFLHRMEQKPLGEDELAFIDGPVEELCAMLDDWQMTHELYDLPEGAWQFIREQGFFGLVIPKDFGGKGFSQRAHSEIVMKIATRSVSAAVTVMVPNSLGPGELLMEYGTDQQKQHYLPRLCAGEEIPCFALTSPMAGSDAGAIPDKGIVCKGQWQGQEVVGLKVTWNKRYITLAPVATLIGLAIKVYDPDHLLGENDTIGVTCVMVPRDTDGVNVGSRHLPMNTVFMNGPTWGNDVFIPLDQVIGGEAMLGHGWTMLLECLSIGRSISLPGLAAGSGKLATLTTGAYAAVREQFGRSISEFEGVQEALEHIAGHSYQMDAARVMTACMLDRGIRPAVPSALLKYRNTDLMRTVVNHSMDVVAGRGVISGPRNFMARIYQAVPIAITVEGANILTRSLMIFGQGAIRCHPFIVDEIEAAGMKDEAAAVTQFDSVFYRHLAHTSGNALRALALALSGGYLADAPARGDIKRYYRQLSRFSAAFALLTDVSLLSLGGGLKAKQRLSGNMADCLVRLYYASAVIKQWHEDGYPESHRTVVEWCLQSNLHELQEHLRRVIDNFPARALRWPMRLMVFPLGAMGLRKPDDALGTALANAITSESEIRERICRGTYVNSKPDDPIGRVLYAFEQANNTQEIRQRLHQAIRKSDPDDLDGVALLMGHESEQLVDWAIEKSIIRNDEREVLLKALAAQYDVIRVDAFDPEGIRELAAAAKGKRRVVERPVNLEK